jgi:hypothetical protein
MQLEAEHRQTTHLVKGLPVFLLVAGLLTGCGSSGTLYTAAKTKTCLAAHGATIKETTGDIVASTATGGAFRAAIAGNSITFAFGSTVADAEGIDAGYRRFAGKNVGIDQVLFQQRNAVMLWHLQPTGNEAGITACLK